jgi:Phosphodiester glycosidase
VTSTRCPSAHGIIACALTVTTLVAIGGAAAPAGAGTGYTTRCPRPESLVTKAAWHRHTLTRGVVLSEGTASDVRGFVSMHVLTVDMTQTGISFRPLMRHLAERSPLSLLTAGHRKLVASTNTSYYDFYTGSPLGPVVNASKPVTAFASGRSVVGIGTDHRVHFGHLRLVGSVTVGRSTHSLAALNVLNVPNGVTLFTPTWGSKYIHLPYGAKTRYVTRGVLSSGTGRWTTPPSSGHLMLVARGTTATNWLSSLRKGATVSSTRAVKADTAVPFRTAFQAGANIVAKPGVVITGLPCRIAYPQPARTALGMANGGRKLILVVVSDHPGTSMHGLDESQMSKVMVDLGAAHAYLFDGSGSSEMIARMPATGLLSMRNYPADGAERTMPVGLGIFRS